MHGIRNALGAVRIVCACGSAVDEGLLVVVAKVLADEDLLDGVEVEEALPHVAAHREHAKVEQHHRHVLDEGLEVLGALPCLLTPDALFRLLGGLLGPALAVELPPHRDGQRGLVDLVRNLPELAEGLGARQPHQVDGELILGGLCPELVEDVQVERPRGARGVEEAHARGVEAPVARDVEQERVEGDVRRVARIEHLPRRHLARPIPLEPAHDLAVLGLASELVVLQLLDEARVGQPAADGVAEAALHVGEHLRERDHLGAAAPGSCVAAVRCGVLLGRLAHVGAQLRHCELLGDVTEPVFHRLELLV